MKEFISVYFIIINIISLSAYYIDKQKAKKHKWRISEAFLIGVAALGGFIGAIVGMRLFRHKTKHLKFILGIPFISIIWMILIGIYIFT